jgi:hypothetical protein
MLGMERRVTPVVPLGRARVQRAPVTVQQRRVRAVANERMDESELACVRVVGAHEVATEQRAGVVRRIVQHMAKHSEVESLADDGRGLHGGLVGRRQAIEAAVHDALDGRRNRRPVRSAAQKLRQEQRIALRPLDASGGDARVRGEIRAGECERVARRQRRADRRRPRRRRAAGRRTGRPRGARCTRRASATRARRRSTHAPRRAPRASPNARPPRRPPGSAARPRASRRS